jgi:DNA polymerase-1
MKILIIDHSNLLYRANFAYPKLSVGDQPVGAFYGFAKTLLSLIAQFKPDQVFIAKDTPKPTFRHKSFAGYKAGRPKPDQGMISQIPLIENWCRAVDFQVLEKEDYEADDLIWTLVKYLQFNLPFTSKQNEGLEFDKDHSKKEFEITKKELKKTYKPPLEFLIYSNDRDLFQLLTETNVQVIQGSKKGVYQLFGQTDFQQKYQLLPSQWLDYKALVGDPSDNLPGLKGVGPKTAQTILKKVGCLFNLCRFLDLPTETFLASVPWVEADLTNFVQDSTNDRFIQNFQQNLDSLKNTYQLSKLVTVPGLGWHLTKFDLSRSQEIFEKFQFKSLWKDLYKVTKEPVRSGSLF